MSAARVMPLPKFGFVESVPALADSAFLLDANIGKDEHKASDQDTWSAAIKDRAYCRLVGFLTKLKKAWPLHPDKSEAVFKAILVERAKSALGLLTGDVKFAPNQVEIAALGQNLTFARAAALVFGFNELVAYQHNQLLASGTADPETLQDWRDCLFKPHCITVLCFYFHGIDSAFEAAVAAEGSEAALLSRMEREAGQPYAVIKSLFGRTSDGRGSKKEIRHCGSYPALRKLFKILEGYPAASAKLDEAPRDQYIQRVHFRGGSKTTLSQNVPTSGRINKPPYDWGPPGSGEPPYPDD